MYSTVVKMLQSISSYNQSTLNIEIEQMIYFSLRIHQQDTQTHINKTHEAQRCTSHISG